MKILKKLKKYLPKKDINFIVKGLITCKECGSRKAFRDGIGFKCYKCKSWIIKDFNKDL